MTTSTCHVQYNYNENYILQSFFVCNSVQLYAVFEYLNLAQIQSISNIKGSKNLVIGSNLGRGTRVGHPCNIVYPYSKKFM